MKWNNKVRIVVWHIFQKRIYARLVDLFWNNTPGYLTYSGNAMHVKFNWVVLTISKDKTITLHCQRPLRFSQNMFWLRRWKVYLGNILSIFKWWRWLNPRGYYQFGLTLKIIFKKSLSQLFIIVLFFGNMTKPKISSSGEQRGIYCLFIFLNPKIHNKPSCFEIKPVLKGLIIIQFHKNFDPTRAALGGLAVRGTSSGHH